MPIIENKLITSIDWKPGYDPRDAIGMSNGMHFDVKNCIIDLTDAEDGTVDEAVGCTKGSSATIENCVIRGVGKAILCGSGDEKDVEKERGKVVTFKNCIIENFCRRGPEVQDGMIVRMYDCMVFNWGNDKFDTRAFGAWAHDDGLIEAHDTLFIKGKGPSIVHWFKDHWNHFWQCVNERGFFRALFHRDAWASGYRRALTAGPDGIVRAHHCYFTKGLVTDHNDNPMSSSDAYYQLTKLIAMKKRLGKQLDWDYQGDIDIYAEDFID